MRTKRFAMIAATVAIIVNLALSTVGFAQGRRGRGHIHNHARHRKAEKFVNGHDARDGRFDGRGPRFRFRDRRDRDIWRDRRRDGWRRRDFPRRGRF